MKDVKRVVSTGMWNDKKVLNEYSAEDKYFMLYLLVNPYTTQLGIYNFPIKHVALDMGYSVDSVNALLDRFENKYQNIKYSKETGEVAIKNYLKYSIISGGKPVFDCLKKETEKVEDKSLLEYVYKALMKTDTTKLNDTVVDYLNYLSNQLNINDSEKDNDNDNDNDNERHVDDSYHDSSKDELNQSIDIVIDYLNIVSGKRFQIKGEKNRKHVRARLNDGFTVDELKEVVDKKTAEWKDNSEMNTYLRPETLFGTKFESYLNQKAVKKAGDMSVEDLASKWGVKR